MKKSIVIFILMVLVLTLVQGTESVYSKRNNGRLEITELSYDEIADKLVRFHVIANSDSKEDQDLKLKVRDTVIDYLKVKLNDCTTLEEAKGVLVDNIDQVNRIAREVIVDNNYDYSVETMLSKEEFPDKIYGDYLFPQGTYSAYRIVIGSGEGKNWWCVMFPPLCFVDETKNTVNSKKMDEEMEQVLGPSEEKKEDKTEKPVLKFKIFEVIKELFS